MLQECPVTVNLPTTDMDAARVFYQETLGLKATNTDGPLMFEAGGGTKIFVYQRPQVTAGDHTAASFHVTAIEDLVAGLKERGVTFEEYDTPEIKTENGISTGEHGKAAWFRDPSGHIIALYQM